MKWLITSFDSKPSSTGGIATFCHEFTKSLAKQKNQKVEFMAPYSLNSDKYDEKQIYPTKRIHLPTRAILSTIPLFYNFLKLRNKFDYSVHFLWLPDGISACLAFKKNYIVVVHAVEILEIKNTFKKKLRHLLKPIKNLVFKNAHLVIAVSEFTKNYLISTTNISSDKIVVIHPGVEFNHWPKVSHNKTSIKSFFTVSRLQDYKGIDVTLHAFHLLKKDGHNDWSYRIAGSGEYLQKLEELVKEYHLEEHVSFLGKIDDEKLKLEYSKTDIFILCSREDWKTPNIEGFGIVFLEAASCGIPSLAGKSGGIPDAVINNETGWLVNPESSIEIKDVLVRTITNPEEVNQFGKNALIRAETKFNWNIVIQNFLEAVNNVRN